MYTIIICPECEQPKVVKDEPMTTTCGRCQSRHNFHELKHYHQTADADEAREVRGAITADLQGKRENFEELVKDGGIDIKAVEERIDSEFQSAQGVDDVSAEQESGDNRSRREIVLDGIEECDPATEESVLEYAVEWGVPRGSAEKLLDRLRNRGLVADTGSELRAV